MTLYESTSERPRWQGSRRLIAYNAGFRVVGRVGGGVLSLVALHLATHYFGPRYWATVVAAVAYVSIFVPASDLGIAAIASRELARRDSTERTIYGAAIVGSLLSSLGGSGIMAAVGSLIYLGHPTVRAFAYLLAPLIIATAVWTASSAVLVAHSRNDIRAVIDVSSSVVLLGGVILVSHLRLGREAYLGAVVASSASAAVLGLAFARRYVRPSFKGARSTVAKLWSSARSVAIAQMLAAVYLRADTILLFLMSGMASVAFYGVAFQLAIFAMSVPGILMSAVLPAYISASTERREQLLQAALDVAVSLAAITPLLVGLLAAPMVRLVAGSHFLPAVPLLAILGGAIALALPNGVFYSALILDGHERLVMRTVGTVTAVNIIGNLAFIPLFGASAAAGVMIVSELAAVVANGRAYRRATTRFPSMKQSAVSVSVAAAISAVLEVVRRATRLGLEGGALAMMAQAVAALVAYLVALFIIRRWLRERARLAS